MSKKLNIKEILAYLEQKGEGIISSKNSISLNEMAYARKEYKRKIEDISSQIIENWCLVRYCRVDKNFRGSDLHWKSELRGHLLTVSRYKLKEKDSVENRYKVVSEVWREIELDSDYEVVDKTINNKFRTEGISTKSLEYAQVLKDCVEEAEEIMKVISYGSISRIDFYLETL